MFQSNDPGVQSPTVPPARPSGQGGNGPRREKVRIVLYGTLAGCDRTIKILHTLRYIEPNDWSDPIPTGRPNEWMVIATRHLLME